MVGMARISRQAHERRQQTEYSRQALPLVAVLLTDAMS